MEHVTVEAVPPTAVGDGSVRRSLGEPLGTTDVALNDYHIVPGEGFPGGLHAHADQEELFVVLEGRATFETMDGEVEVAAGEAVRFAPGEFQSGRNDADEPLRALALGAPRDTEDVRVPVDCPACGRGDLRLDTEGTGLVCPDCEAEYVPEDCPACGGEPAAALGDDGRPAVVCPDCGAAFDEAPLDERA